jgi:epoxyqueuosine reductase
MEVCERCTACRDKCPTGAIPSDRFLLRAERCLTYLNEHEGEFPAWLDPAVHHCLEGCLFCQSYCPVNRQIPLAIEDGPTFDDQETELVLQGASKDRLPEATIQKLEEFGFQDGLPEIARNLRALLDHPQNLMTAPRLLRRAAG